MKFQIALEINSVKDIQFDGIRYRFSLVHNHLGEDVLSIEHFGFGDGYDNQTINITIFEYESADNVTLIRQEDVTFTQFAKKKIIPLEDRSERIIVRVKIINDSPKHYPKFDPKLLPAQSSFNEDFAKLWNDESTKNVTFIIDSKAIKAHKLILSTRSPVFKTMLETDMSENKTSVVDLMDKSASFEGFKTFLKFLYTDQVKEEDLSEELLYLADKYQVLSLKEKAANALIQKINETNAKDILILLGRHRVFPLVREAAKFVAKHHKQILTAEVKDELERFEPLIAEFIQGFVEAFGY